jgi:alpha-ribazole phosphatase
MILHLIRHPKPVIAEGVCYGRLDIAAENAPGIADHLRGTLPPGLPLWSSPLRRCQALAEALHPRPLLDERLAEMDFGAWEGRPWDTIPSAELDAWAADIGAYAPPGGESPFAVQERALDFVDGLDVPEAIIVTHAGVIRVLLAHWHDLPPEAWPQLTFAYGSLTTVEVRRQAGGGRDGRERR